jgi:regulatory protein
MGLLARREHGITELTRKLILKGLPEDLVHEAIEKLASDGLISDQRFCESMTNYQYQRGQGPQKIRYKLRSDGVSDEIIESTFELLSPDWEASLNRLFQKKYSDSAARTPSERAKQVRFLSSRGFPQEMIYRLLNERKSD